MPQFTPGEEGVAIATFPVKPAGLSCEAELFLGPDEVTKVSTSDRIGFTSTGAEQSVDLPITMPSTEGTYHVYIDIYAEGILIPAYQAVEDVVIAPVIGISGWSTVVTAPIILIPNPYLGNPLILHEGEELILTLEDYLKIPARLDWAYYMTKQRFPLIWSIRSTPRREPEQYLGLAGFDARNTVPNYLQRCFSYEYGLCQGTSRDGYEGTEAWEVRIKGDPALTPRGTYDIVFRVDCSYQIHPGAYDPYTVCYFVIPCAYVFEEADECGLPDEALLADSCPGPSTWYPYNIRLNGRVFG